MKAPVIMRWVVVGAFAFALVGCSGERATEAVTERAVVATHAAAENTPDVEVFTVDISGDVSLAMPPGDIRYETVAETTVAGSGVPAHRALRLTSEVDGQVVEVRLLFASDLETGTHEIDAGAFDALRSQAAAGLGEYSLAGGPTGADAVWFNNAVDGSLTLDKVGESVSGHFEFTAEAMRTVDGTEIPGVIMVAGTFDDVPLVGSAEATATEEPTAVRSAEPTAEATEPAG